jgi:hypothetical protein
MRPQPCGNPARPCGYRGALHLVRQAYEVCCRLSIAASNQSTCECSVFTCFYDQPVGEPSRRVIAIRILIGDRTFQPLNGVLFDVL